MTLWFANLVAYSVQLAVLVGVAAGVAALLRIHRPAAALRFWQGIFVAALLWPAYQVWAHAAGRGHVGGQVFRSVAGWASAAPVVEMAPFGSTLVVMTLVVVAGGAVFRLLRIVLGLRELGAMRDRSVPAASLAVMTGAMQNALATTADVCFTSEVTSPATFGAVRPTVLLPRCVEQLPPQVQQAILCHELLHVRRRDWLATLGEEAWCAMLWFHPAARALAAQISFVRETLVDQAAIAHTGDRRAYAAALLAFATTEPPLVGAAPLIGGRSFERRIALLAQEPPMDRKFLRLRMCVAALAVAAATVIATMMVPFGATVGAQTQSVYQPGDGVTLPRIVKEVKPSYTAEAMQAKVQGTVWLTAVVLPSGDVGDVTVRTSLDKEHGLDEQAVRALKQWKFEPGTKDGKAVAVEVTVEMTFTLKK